MKYRPIAGSALEISVVSVGGNVFGYFCELDETRRIITAAEEVGINFLDTADVYSDGRSEELLGEALRGRRDRWGIATKVGVKSGETGRGIGRRETIIARLEGSLRRLRTDRIDVYQLHHFDPETPLEETLGAMQDLIRMGKIRHFGLSNCSPEQVQAFDAASRASARPLFATNQVHYNILKREVETEMIPLFNNTQRSLLAYGVLGRGVLSGKYRAGARVPANSRAAVSQRVHSDLQPRVLDAVAQLETVGSACGVSLPHLALGYVLRSEAIASAIIGFRSIAQLRSLANFNFEQPSTFWGQVDSTIERLGSFDAVSLGSP